MPTQEWISVSDVRPGDRVRVPGGSSWSVWASRRQAEAFDAPFRTVERAFVGWEGTSRIRLCFEDGYACQMPREARVLRTRT
jgi:hypothetical protein